MCIVSDKIKFCTCVDGSYQDLPHYWLLYRFNKQKGLQCVGEAIMPYDMMQPNHQINKQTLEARLNEPDAFDKVISFKPKDQMEIVINNLDNPLERMIFCFKFIRGKWKSEEFDPFELMSRYDEFAFGDFKQLEREEKEQNREK